MKEYNEQQIFENTLSVLAGIAMIILLVVIGKNKPDATGIEIPALEKLLEIKQHSKQTQTQLSDYQSWRSWNQIECLANNIYYEARGEPIEGQIAVGVVTLNRVKDARWASNICDVVKQKNTVVYYDASQQPNTKKVCQFSWVCENNQYYQKSSDAWNKSLELSYQLVNTTKHTRYASIYKDAFYFHADTVDPEWNKNLKLIKQTGSHLFYKDR